MYYITYIYISTCRSEMISRNMKMSLQFQIRRIEISLLKIQGLTCHTLSISELQLAWWHMEPGYHIMTSLNENIFRINGPLLGESTGCGWIPLTKASDAELWYFLWSLFTSTTIFMQECGNYEDGRRDSKLIKPWSEMTMYLIHTL